MEQIRIKSVLDNYFAEAWSLYENAFPLEERRLIDAQTSLLIVSNYHFDVIIKDKIFIGFILWWDFDGLIYIEYFATAESQRNMGFGKRIIKRFIQRNQNSIILEVEVPNSNIKKRRIEFYKRLGFQLNTHYYEIPPMHEGFTSLELLIMSFPDPISKEDLNNFKEQYHPIIFKD